MSLLFYIPGTAADRERVLREQLADVFGAERPVTNEVLRDGPDGGRGSVLGFRGQPGVPGYHPDRQAWHDSEAGFWVGVPADFNPDSIAREESYGGYLVKLDDGREWLIPVARQFPAGSPFPKTLKLGPDGELREVEKTRFADICEAAESIHGPIYAAVDDRLAGRASGEVKIPVDSKEAFRIARMALALNYRVNASVVSALGLFDTKNVHAILNAIVDVPAYYVHRLAEARAEGEARARGQESSPDTAGGGPA